jgi:hypothetical protein
MGILCLLGEGYKMCVILFRGLGMFLCQATTHCKHENYKHSPPITAFRSNITRQKNNTVFVRRDKLYTILL